MGVHLDIPDDVAQAIRIPEDRIESELSIELAVMLYARGFLFFGKARKLAKMGKFEFGRLLGKRGVVRHYTKEELEDDLTYAWPVVSKGRGIK